MLHIMQENPTCREGRGHVQHAKEEKKLLIFKAISKALTCTLNMKIFS